MDIHLPRLAATENSYGVVAHSEEDQVFALKRDERTEYGVLGRIERRVALTRRYPRCPMPDQGKPPSLSSPWNTELNVGIGRWQVLGTIWDAWHGGLDVPDAGPRALAHDLGALKVGIQAMDQVTKRRWVVFPGGRPINNDKAVL